MTKKSRAILFSICAFLFILTAVGAIFYSQGYRFDFEKKKTTQTGAFYFKIMPRGAQIYFDGQLKKKTDFFFGAALIDNLLPKKYKVEIKKEGYHPWEKTLEIKEKQVTEAKNIVLIPESPNFFILAKEVKDYFVSPDEKKIVLKEIRKTGEKAGEKTGWELKLYDLKNNIKSHLIKSGDIAKKEVELFDLTFSPDSKKILLKVGLGEELKYFLLDLDKTPALLISLDFLGKDLENVSFNPRDPQKLFFLKAGELNEADLIKKELSPTPLENIFTWTILNDNIYYLDKSGYLFKTDFSFGPRDKINTASFPLKEEIKYEIKAFSNFIFLRENEGLYLFNKEGGNFEKFFEKIKGLKISPDSDKIVYFSDFEIWILFLKEQYNQPQKLAGEKLFIARFSEKIDEISWFNSHYLVFNSGNKIKITEIDDRDRINIVDLAEFKKPKIFFNQTDKKLYLFSEGNLFSSGKLLP